MSDSNPSNPDTRKSPRSALPFVERQALPTAPWEVKLTVVDSEETTSFAVREWVTLGRKCSEKYEQNHIDLTDFKANELGVSRIHAAIHARKNFLTLQDLGSTNGTQLNGFAVSAYQNVPLEGGDEIMLGAMRLKVTFTRAESSEEDSTATRMSYDDMLEETRHVKKEKDPKDSTRKVNLD
jgi:predicted component of type VI protein secretion system